MLMMILMLVVVGGYGGNCVDCIVVGVGIGVGGNVGRVDWGCCCCWGQ